MNHRWIEGLNGNGPDPFFVPTSVSASEGWWRRRRLDGGARHRAMRLRSSIVT